MSHGPPLELEVGFSPCPNDTFIFDALINRRIDTAPFRFIARIADVEELNERGFDEKGAYPLTKLSFYAYLLLKDRYCLLDSGAALGYGCGPILITRKEEGEHGGTSPDWLRKARIAVPGRYTTAHLLLQLWRNGCEKIRFVRFDEILPGVASGKYDAGLIIHEGRFVYQGYDCRKLIDLGQWWEAETGLPLPLGCIALRRDLQRHKEAIETLLRQSVDHARRNPQAGIAFIKGHAQEFDEQILSSHISLYVNDFTLSLGETGIRAVDTLEAKARCLAIL
ncbi:MAG: 1,4-dihydroxy-6-naphthoate synthase [Thermodesulfobacteriota bacterium]